MICPSLPFRRIAPIRSLARALRGSRCRALDMCETASGGKKGLGEEERPGRGRF